MYFKGEKELYYQTDWDELCTKEFMGQLFSDDTAKKARPYMDFDFWPFYT